MMKTFKNTPESSANLLRSLIMGIVVITSSAIFNNLQAQYVVSKKKFMKMEEEANKKLDPLFEAPFTYLYGTWVQQHINTEIANQHIDTDNLDPEFLTAEIMKLLEWAEWDSTKPALTQNQIIQAVEDSVMSLLLTEYGELAQIYVQHINDHGKIILQKNRTAGWDPFNRVAMPRKSKIDGIKNLFKGKGKVSKEFAETKTTEIEGIIDESLQLLITKFGGYRKANDVTVEDAVFRATNDAYRSAEKKIRPLVRALVTEAVNEIFQDPTTK